jgi:hypothetical protein
MPTFTQKSLSTGVDILEYPTPTEITSGILSNRCAQEAVQKEALRFNIRPSIKEFVAFEELFSYFFCLAEKT